MSGQITPQERIAAAWNTFQIRIQAIHTKALQILRRSDETERDEKLENLKKRLS